MTTGTEKRRIRLPCYDIEIELANGGGSITHNGYEECPQCGSCCCIDPEHDPDAIGRLEFNAALDGIMSMVLAHAVAGIDVTNEAYVEGIETAVEAAANAL